MSHNRFYVLPFYSIINDLSTTPVTPERLNLTQPVLAYFINQSPP